MPIIQPWETDLILWLRHALPNLVGPFEAVTALGGETFFLVLLPLLYWCVDRSMGARITLLYLGSAYINGVAKRLFDMPRPLDAGSAELRGLFPQGVEIAREQYDATGNGFPSGHTQSTVVFWGYLAAQINGRLGRLRLRREQPSRPEVTWLPLLLALAAALILLVPLSRIYLAVHYPRDIAGGFLFGFATLTLFLALGPKLESVLDRLTVAGQLALAAGLPLVGALTVRDEITITAAGALLGMGVGFVLERRWVRFATTGSVVQRAGRFAAGIAVLGVLYVGLKVVFAGLEPHLIFRFVRYALMGVWGALGAPWSFIRLGLAGSSHPTDLKV